jgi:hypothetical protein
MVFKGFILSVYLILMFFGLFEMGGREFFGVELSLIAITMALSLVLKGEANETEEH